MHDDRWERRAWFEGPHEAGERLSREGEEIGAAYRTDTYLLAADEALLTKLRGGELFEVKRRLDVRDGLERWVMEASLPFPLGAEDAAAVLPGAPAHALASPAALTAYAETVPGLTVVPMRKHRRRYRLGEAEAEVTAVQAGERIVETVGVEAATFEAARTAAERLGTSGLPNEGYGAWLRRVSPAAS